MDLVRAARLKAEEARCSPEELVIGADTGVFHRGRHFGKPRDLDEARWMLTQLSGDWHHVYTGLVLKWGELELHELVLTRVRFRDLSPEEISWYLSCEEVLDKAGAYAIQGRASAFVTGLEGDFFNVMGLPLEVLYRMLLEFGWRPRRVVKGDGRR
jgi:septum formation protein